MTSVNFNDIRLGLASLPSDHDADGMHRPKVEEIFAPEQHANALDPNTPVVVGARGTGKSFWAGVLEQDDTRNVTALAYPHLGLNDVVVVAGYTGFSGGTGVDPKTIFARVPEGSEDQFAVDFWHAVVIRAAKTALDPHYDKSVREVMQEFSDPEDLGAELKRLDARFAKKSKTLLITFDALDTLSRNWKRSILLIDALFEVIWSLRARRAIRAKLFIRPEQLNDESLRFVELPKLRSGRVELNWTQLDLYGLLFWRLANSAQGKSAFAKLCKEIGSPIPTKLSAARRTQWPLLFDKELQKKTTSLLAGPYMGKSFKKGGTYDWPYKHLADAKGKVTPRSFIKLFSEAANYGQSLADTAISHEGIRHGLREASKVRVDQLGIEYVWVKRALAPLAGLIVPCTLDDICERWIQTDTIAMIMNAAESEHGFLPPFNPRLKGDQERLLASAMEKIGLFSTRADDRIDIPDLFRVAAKMLKKGATTPVQRG
ncbi:hypothetical protein [Herbaspirillum robiniae]|uniref:hypothetical protein n=1 Tax=Herbaspirillum robiniae TaxID=2014887 RepID=UPI0009A190EE|nr:hypothetical protein [Herbaspirillum robiniae]